jgi:hypothetical protein
MVERRDVKYPCPRIADWLGCSYIALYIYMEEPLIWCPFLTLVPCRYQELCATWSKFCPNRILGHEDILRSRNQQRRYNLIWGS